MSTRWKLYFFALLMGLSNASVTKAQEIEIASYVDWQDMALPVEAHKLLLDKMSAMLTHNGIRDGVNSPFVLANDVSVLEHQVTATAPPQHMQKIKVHFFIGNVDSTELLSSYDQTLTGMGTTTTKAYLDALRKVDVTSSVYKGLTSVAKEKILTYYNTQCPSVMSEVSEREDAQEYGRALDLLGSIPRASKCYQGVKAATARIEKKRALLAEN